jgi:hypothetical protein
LVGLALKSAKPTNAPGWKPGFPVTVHPDVRERSGRRVELLAEIGTPLLSLASEPADGELIDFNLTHS